MIGPIPIDHININLNRATSITNNNDDEYDYDDYDNDDDNDNMNTNMNNTNNINNSNNNNTGTPTRQNHNRELWIEHERRQRTIRFLMMFLMMLILMDGEQQQKAQIHKQELLSNKKNGNKNNHLRKGGVSKDNNYSNSSVDNDDDNVYVGHDHGNSILSLELFQARQALDDKIWNYSTSQRDSRFVALLRLNRNVDVQTKVWDYAMATATATTSSSSATSSANTADAATSDELKEMVYRYPTNATGYFRGHWTRISKSSSSVSTSPSSTDAAATNNNNAFTTNNYNSTATDVNSDTNNNNNHHHRGEKMKILTHSKQINDAIHTSHLQWKHRPRQNGDYNDVTYATYGVFLLPTDEMLYGSADDQIQLLSSEGNNLDHGKSSDGYDGTVAYRDHDATDNNINNNTTTISTTISTTKSTTITPTTTSNKQKEGPLYITEQSGRIHFHLYSRSIRGMKSISLIDGYVKVHGINDYGFANAKKHLFLRLHGVMVHASGKISLVSNAGPLRSVFTNLNENDGDGGGVRKCRHSLESKVPTVEQQRSRRRLQNQVVELEHRGDYDNVNQYQKKLKDIRDLALVSYSHFFDSHKIGGDEWKLFSSNLETNDYGNFDRGVVNDLDNRIISSNQDVSGRARRLSQDDAVKALKDTDDDCGEPGKFWFSSIAQPYPYVPHETNITKESNRVLFNRMYTNIPEVLFNNYCEYEINLHVNETQVKLKDWQEMAMRMIREINNVNPFATNHNSTVADEETEVEDALVTNFFGMMESPNCDFALSFNATALRTDWEATKFKVTLYSVYMMIASLAQIIILLRQIIYAQASMVATRVSLLCIGWLTVLDAILCIAHIMLCLMVPPVSTAFFMVALFKFLLFYVVALKYMAMIMEARSNAAGQPSTASDRRRRFAALQFRFYCVLFAAIMAIWYIAVGQLRRKLVVLIMYSFWVPQIIYNAITETKKPLHKHFIYGNSITRLNLPLLLFGVPKNFMQEIEPEFPSDYNICWMLLIWVSIQTGLLICQEKYGSRFMIPARFLPPKYNYSRKIPPSLLPAQESHSRSHASSDESDNVALLGNDVMNDTKGPRNRKEKRSRNGDGNGITTVHEEEGDKPTVDCVICYNPIDVMDRRSYMLAPCDHIFHRSCLEQWMEVKMECPICRTDLPAP